MIQINKKLISELLGKASINPRLRHSFDLRNPQDGGQRMLNALMPGTVVPIHRHPTSNENVILIYGKLDEIIFDDEGREIERTSLDSSISNFGCVVPVGTWRSIEVLEPSILYEAKDGKYGEDGSETLEFYKAKNKQTHIRHP